MIINYSYTPEFEEVFEELKKHPKYQELADMDGIGKQCDIASFSKKFFSKNNNPTADVSVDANANVEDGSLIAYEVESSKPVSRLNAYFLLYKYGKQLFDKKTAEQMVRGQFLKDYYVNDFHKFHGTPYCYNFSCVDVIFQGLPFVKKIKSDPPKHLSSFMGQMIQFVTYASNSVAGAVGLADFLVCVSWYVDKMFRENPAVPKDYLWKQVRQELQSFIFSVNQPFRGGQQSAFTNVSLFDDVFLDKICSEYHFPDGSAPDKATVQDLQVLYMELYNETLRSTPFTFPVTTACFAVDNDRNVIDREFMATVMSYNIESGFMNIYAGKTSTLSSCCFDGSQKTLTKSSNGVNLMTFKELYGTKWEDTRRNFTIFHNGSWCKGNIIKIPKADHKIYKVVTVNNKEILVTDNHINLTLNGEKETAELTTNDYLMFNTFPLDSFPEQDHKLTYEQGVFIGSYLGDGSLDRRDGKNELQFSLNKDKFEKLLPFFKDALEKWGIKTNIHLCRVNGELYPVRVYNKRANSIIKHWVQGNYANTKSINMNCLLQSREFRKGIIDGLYITDGGNSNRIYTTSPAMAEQLETIMSSLGMPSVINIADRTDEACVIKGEQYTRNFPLYCVRWYSGGNKRSMKDIYVVRNNVMYFKIKTIEEITVDNADVYCFEMKNTNEPYFTLPNGIITHNCRLRSEGDTEYFNSFGSGGTKIGSLSVVTLNLPRMAHGSIDSGNVAKNHFLTVLKYKVELAAKINHVKRHIVNKRIQNGNLPLYTLGFMDINRQYSTCGLNGINEAVEILGYDILKPEGQQLVKEILETVNEVNRNMQQKFKSPHNTEQTPSENSSIKLAQTDKLLGYQKDYELYSNQFIPLTTKADLLDRIKLQGMFDSLLTGGAICHINVDAKVEDPKAMEDLMVHAIKQGVIYSAINYNIQKCTNDHMSIGKSDKCSVCGANIEENFTRVVGFLTSTKNWHKVRRERDYPKRQFYEGI